MTRAKSRMVVHATWSTYWRRPILTEEIEELVESVLRTQCALVASRLLAFGASLDHVHVVFTLPATLSLSAMMKSLKGATGAILSRQTRGAGAWERGYFAESARPAQLEALLRYVERQREHHRDRSTVDEWEDP